MYSRPQRGGQPNPWRSRSFENPGSASNKFKSSLQNGKQPAPKRNNWFKRRRNKRNIASNPPLLFDWKHIDEKTVETIQEKMDTGVLNPEKDMRNETQDLPPLKQRKKTRYSYTPALGDIPQNPNIPMLIGVISWNVEGKGSPEEIDKALTERVKTPDIVCLQEINVSTSVDSTEHFKWLHSGTQGSAILINKAFKTAQVTLTKSVCEQIYFADVEIENLEKLRVISCLIPPSTNYLSEELWVKLEQVVKEVPTDFKFVIAGDFNAQIGKDDASKPIYKGNVGVGLEHQTSNENGLKLIDLARRAFLRIVNTWRSVDDTNNTNIHTVEDGGIKIQQDFILIQRYVPFQGYYTPYCKSLFHWMPNYRHAILECSLKVYKKKFFLNLENGKEDVVPLVVSTWNIHGANPSKMDTILDEQKLFVVCIQEIFITSDADLQTENFTWHFSGKHWSKGVGIAVKKSSDVQLIKFESISDYLCTADLMLFGTPIKVVSCFVPPSDDSRNETVKSELSKLVESIPEGTMYFVGGDFNAQFINSKLSESEDSNELYLKNLVEERYLSLGLDEKLWDDKLTMSQHVQPIITKVTETYSGRPHHILMPITVKLDKMTKLVTHFVPFFENSIVSLVLAENYNKEGEGIKNSVKYETKDGLVYKIRMYEVMEDIECDETCRPSVEDQEKFKDSLPSNEDLARLLKDFVILNTANVRGCLPKSPLSTYAMNILIASFREAKKFGSFVLEEVEAASYYKYESPTVRIRWQGIVLGEIKTTKRRNLTWVEVNRQQKLVAAQVIEKLCSFSYMIKERLSYHNKGCEPAWMNDPQFKDVIKAYKKTDCPTIPEVLKHIENFFTEDTDCELVFGPDFDKGELETIERFATENNLNHRYFTLAGNPDSKMISVSKKRTPQYIRDKVLKNDKDPKYCLIPPYKSGTDLRKYIISYEQESSIHQEDCKLISKFWTHIDTKKKNENKVPAHNTDTSKTKTSTIVKKPVATSENGQPSQSRQIVAKQRGPKTQQNRQRKRGVDYDDLSQELQQWKSPPSYKNTRDLRHSQFVEQRFDSEYPLPKRRMLHEEGNPSLRREGYLPQENLLETLPRKKLPQWIHCDPLIVVWPISIRSLLEERPSVVLSENFPTEFLVNRHNYTAAVVTLPMRDGSQKKFCLSVGSDQKRVAREALDLIVKHSTVIKPSSSYLFNGQAPNFIRYNVPCQTNPRTYIILSRRETGPLEHENLFEIMEAFVASFNEDVFFDRFSYTLEEKNRIIYLAQKYKLKCRHFGDAPGLKDRWVCVYKMKPKEQLLEELLKMRGHHYKYTITTDRLPPRVGMNIF